MESKGAYIFSGEIICCLGQPAVREVRKSRQGRVCQQAQRLGMQRDSSAGDQAVQKAEPNISSQVSANVAPPRLKAALSDPLSSLHLPACGQLRPSLCSTSPARPTLSSHRAAKIYEGQEDCLAVNWRKYNDQRSPRPATGVQKHSCCWVTAAQSRCEGVWEPQTYHRMTIFSDFPHEQSAHD